MNTVLQQKKKLFDQTQIPNVTIPVKIVSFSFSGRKKIEFRDASDLNRVILTHSVAPLEPGIMCTGTAPSTLLFVDASKRPREVHWLDLSDGQPKPAAGKRVIHTKMHDIYGMCFAQDGDQKLLVYTASQTLCGDGKIFVHNMVTDKLEWEVDGNLPGMPRNLFALHVVSDGRGHLFVGDRRNGCIQIFSVVDGQYLGCLMKDVEDFRETYRIYWSEKTSSLICSCYSIEELSSLHYLKVFSVQRPI